MNETHNVAPPFQGGKGEIPAESAINLRAYARADSSCSNA